MDRLILSKRCGVNVVNTKKKQEDQGGPKSLTLVSEFEPKTQSSRAVWYMYPEATI